MHRQTNFDQLFRGIESLDLKDKSNIIERFGSDYEEEEVEYGESLIWDNLITISIDSEGSIEQLSFIFTTSEFNYGPYQISPFNGELFIGKSTELSALLMYFNFNKIEYSIINSTVDWDILHIVLQKLDIELYYDLSLGELVRIDFNAS